MKRVQTFYPIVLSYRVQASLCLKFVCQKIAHAIDEVRPCVVKQALCHTEVTKL
jgi:hypothetical protein